MIYNDSLIEEYFSNIKEDIISDIKENLSILKSKFIINHHLNSDRSFYYFEALIDYQEDRFEDYKKRIIHLNEYYKKKFLSYDLSDKRREIIKRKLKGTAIVYRSFLSLKNVLDMQREEIRKQYKKFKQNRVESKIEKKIRRVMKHDLYSLIHAEEIHLSLSILIFEKRNRDIVSFSKHVKTLEKLANYERKVLVTALFFNSLPIHGIGDLLSLPVWATEGVLVLYEHHFREYHEWKQSQKRNLVQLYEELDKIDFTDD